MPTDAQAGGSDRVLSAPEFDRLMRPFAPTSQLAVAVSGGADSVGLMFLLAQWRDWRSAMGRLVPTVTVLTVNHGLRPEAADEVNAVKKWARALGLPHKALVWEGAKPGSNIQAAARAARYRLMTDWCRKGSVTADLLLAHHLDDQAETFLMRLQRGSGVDGLSGMASVARRNGVRLLRPLLEVPRDRIRATLAKANHPWIEDPSNEDDKYLRVQVRNTLPLLEELGLGRERLVATTRAMARARVALERMTDQLEDQAVDWHPFGFAVTDGRVVSAAPEETALRLLARLIKTMGSADYAPRLSALEGLLETICDSGLGRGRTLGGVKFSARGHHFLCVREPAGADDTPLFLKAGKATVWDGRFEVTMKKNLGEEEVRALGKQGVQVLKGEGISGPSGVPKLALETLPALWDGTELLAQPHLGYEAPNAPFFSANFLK